MPHDYDPTVRRYRLNGRIVSRHAVRDEIEKLTDLVKREARGIADKYAKGTIMAGELNLAMRELLKAAHIVAASVGRGGRERMSQRDWGKVGAKIKWQYGYLDKFTRKLAQGRIPDALTASRAQAYASSIYVSYSTTFHEAQTEFTDRNPKNELRARLIQNSKEGCEECTADANEGWMPVSEMGEIGTRICGDFCLCEIEFEGEDEQLSEAEQDAAARAALGFTLGE